MDINNFTQFANLLCDKQLTHVHPAFNKIVACMMVYNSLCACGGNSNQDKMNKQTECNRIYREAMGILFTVKAQLFKGCNDNCINFYVDNAHLIKTIHR